MRLSARAAINAMIKPANLLASVALVACITSDNENISACDQCDSMAVACDSCSSRSGIANRGGTPDGPIFKTLDALAGGIEKLTGLDQCPSSGCDSGCGCDAGPSGCDDACDAAMIQELSAPVYVPAPSYSPTPAQPAIPQTVTPHYSDPVPHTEPRMPTVPPESYSAPSDANTTRPYVDQPLMPVPAEDPVAPEPEPTEDPAPTQPDATPPAPDSDRSIFDSLDDPFGDDEVRVHPRNRTIRTASHVNRVPTHHHQPVTHHHRSQPKNTLANSGGLLGQIFGTRKTAPAHPATTQRSTTTRRPTVAKAASASAVRHAHQPAVRHQTTHRHVTHTQSTRQHAAQRTVQHASPARTNQVQLRKAPATKAAPTTQPTRQIYGQRHSTMRTSAYGHTMNR